MGSVRWIPRTALESTEARRDGSGGSGELGFWTFGLTGETNSEPPRFVCDGMIRPCMSGN